MELTKKEKKVREELTRIYPQLVINCRKTAGAAFEKHGGDLLAVCVEFFLSKETDYQVKVVEDGKLENYITKMMGMQLKLGTTRFYHQYRKWHEKQREFFPNYIYEKSNDFEIPFQDEENTALTCIQSLIEEMNPYEKMLVNELILDTNTMTSVAQKYSIGYNTVKQDFIKLKNILKKKCQHHL